MNIRPFALEASHYLGESYVTPFNVSTPVMCYNKDLFREGGLDPEAPPATWDELLEAGRTLTGGETYGLNPPPQWVRWAVTWVWVCPDQVDGSGS